MERQDLVYFENIGLISNNQAGVMLVLLIQRNNSYKILVNVYTHTRSEDREDDQNVYHGKHIFMIQQGWGIER